MLVREKTLSKTVSSVVFDTIFFLCQEARFSEYKPLEYQKEMERASGLFFFRK